MIDVIHLDLHAGQQCVCACVCVCVCVRYACSTPRTWICSLVDAADSSPDTVAPEVSLTTPEVSPTTPEVSSAAVAPPGGSSAPRMRRSSLIISAVRFTYLQRSGRCVCVREVCVHEKSARV